MLKQRVIERDVRLDKECACNFYYIRENESKAGIKYRNLKKVPQSPIDYRKMAEEDLQIRQMLRWKR